MAGNPNPSPATRFKPGQVANPTGKTSEQAKLDRDSAVLAARIRHAALSRMMEKIETGELEPLDAMTTEHLRLFKDSEDRAFGTPTQTVNATVKGVVSATPVTPEQWAKMHGDED